MTDEFDEVGIPVQHLRARRPERDAITRQRFPVARLVSRAYRSASEPLRARMLACLLRPLGTLSLVAVASGAFGKFLHRDRATLDMSAIDDIARYSGDQFLELARFVHEVNPETLQQLVALLADNTVGVAALSASAIALIYRRMQPQVVPAQRLERGPVDPADLNAPGAGGKPCSPPRIASA